MRIEKIRMLYFRNLHSVYHEPEPGLNLFLGSNAQGKTSFLEGIYMLARPVSFRPGKDAELVQYDCSRFMLQARCVKQEEECKISVQFDREKGKKEIFFNEKKSGYRNAKGLKVVLFTPDDLSLVKGTPAGRRRFLDFMLCQMDERYEKSYLDFQALLKKRNLLLRSDQRNSPGFEAVNELFVQTAAAVLWDRIRYTDMLQKIAEDIFAAVYPGGIRLSLRYALSFPTEKGTVKKEELYENLKRQLEAVKARENQALKTLSGPHLDDLNFYLNGRSARNFGSQGQQRSIAVTLKMAEVLLFERIRGDYPVLLLDEVLSELDNQKKQQLFEWLYHAPFQSFLTAVNLDGITHPKEMKISRFENGFLHPSNLP